LFAGHAALALLVKGMRPRVSLALLVPVAFAPDVVEWIAYGLGYYNREISHSLVSVGIAATVVALIYYLATRVAPGAIAVWLTYVSHWPADFITGRKPTWPGGPTVGLMLYSHAPVDALVESLLVVLCWLAYRRLLPEADRRRAGSIAVPFGLIAMQIAFDSIQRPPLP
jgi:membrane-bound metal-dependent hydrolase YbcI (DUF457 family)